LKAHPQVALYLLKSTASFHPNRTVRTVRTPYIRNKRNIPLYVRTYYVLVRSCQVIVVFELLLGSAQAESVLRGEIRRRLSRLLCLGRDGTWNLFESS